MARLEMVYVKNFIQRVICSEISCVKNLGFVGQLQIRFVSRA